MENEEKKECNNTPEGEDCPVHGKKNCKTGDKKRKKGYYGLEDQAKKDEDATTDLDQIPNSDDSSSTNEGVDMHKKMTGREKRRSMDDFKKQRDEAIARRKDKEERDGLRHTRMTKGIRFYDSKGSGYMKGGKKIYD